MATTAPIKTPIPMILPAYKAASGFHNFAFSLLPSVFCLLSPVFCLLSPVFCILSSAALYICREPSTLVERTLQIDYFLCKTNPIFSEAKSTQPSFPQRIMKINGSGESEKTNPIQTQFKPKQTQFPKKPKMNLNFYSTKDYDNKPPLRALGKQTQFKPNRTQFPLPQTSPLAHSPTIRNTRYEIRHTTYPIRDTKYKPKTGTHKMGLKSNFQTAGNKFHTPPPAARPGLLELDRSTRRRIIVPKAQAAPFKRKTLQKKEIWLIYSSQQ